MDPGLRIIHGDLKCTAGPHIEKMRSFALAVFVSFIVAFPARGDVRVGDAFPPLATAGLVSGALPAIRGKVVLVDFWASWCAPCKLSFAAYGRLNSEFASRGLVIIAVSVDQKGADYGAFIRKLSPAFFVALDRGQKLVSTVGVPTMPTSYLLDGGGTVRFIHAGFRGPETEQALRTEIASLISERAR
jgi:thiol-disulfide isomerase/thioredoxin